MNTWLNSGLPGLGAVTVIADAPLFPSEVAVMVAEPAARPVTSPVPLTRAIVLSPLDHVTTRPVSGFPFASFGVAVSCTVWPTCTLGDAGLTVSDATGSGEVGDVERSQLDASVPAMTNVAAVTDQDFHENGITRATYRRRFDRIGDRGHARTGKKGCLVPSTCRPEVQEPTSPPRRSLPAQLFHQRPQLRPTVTATHQKREQAAFVHGNRQTGQLPRAFRRHGARLDPRVDPLLLERPAHRVLRRVALDTLRL